MGLAKHVGLVCGRDVVRTLEIMKLGNLVFSVNYINPVVLHSHPLAQVPERSIGPRMQTSLSPQNKNRTSQQDLLLRLQSYRFDRFLGFPERLFAPATAFFFFKVGRGACFFALLVFRVALLAFRLLAVLVTAAGGAAAGVAVKTPAISSSTRSMMPFGFGGMSAPFFVAAPKCSNRTSATKKKPGSFYYLAFRTQLSPPGKSDSAVFTGQFLILGSATIGDLSNC